MRIGVDIGGTFTDLVAYDDEGGFCSSKSSTTPDDLSIGIEECLKKANIDLSKTTMFTHGSTIAINTVIERKGAKMALLTTDGFRDVYEIGRGNRPDAYNIFFKRPVPLVSRDFRLEVKGRLNRDGQVMVPFDEDSAAEAMKRLNDLGVESIAVCFIHSYVNPQHEVEMGLILGREHPEAYVSLSHEILREFREYERTSTTVLNAYVGPIVSKYISKLEDLLQRTGFGGKLLIMQSNGGAMSAETAKKMPVTMMESGPVAGVIGAARVGEQLGYRNVIAFDMGGTTAKASLIANGEPKIATGYYIGGYASGHPMMLPVVDIVEVGAGGGSIAWIDPAGALKVGPRSAGAKPGPVCYDKGGTEPTVTDANVALGRINPSYFLGGEMRVNLEKASETIKQKIADKFGMSTMSAALGILKIADSHMSLAVRAVSVERGYDPREFAMVASGGAGPLHAVSIARELSIPIVVIPEMPAHFSALGMLLTDLRHDYVQTFVRDFAGADINEINNVFAEMEQKGLATLRDEGALMDSTQFPRAIDMRYRGQEYTMSVPVPSQRIVDGDSSSIRKKFDELHELRYGHSAPEEKVEIVNLRLTAIGSVSKSESVQETKIGDGGADRGTRKVCLSEADGYAECPIYSREALVPGEKIYGPAIIEEYATATVIYAGDKAWATASGQLIIEIGAS